jgi:hypothetical protein
MHVYLWARAHTHTHTHARTHLDKAWIGVAEHLRLKLQCGREGAQAVVSATVQSVRKQNVQFVQGLEALRRIRAAQAHTGAHRHTHSMHRHTQAHTGTHRHTPRMQVSRDYRETGTLDVNLDPNALSIYTSVHLCTCPSLPYLQTKQVATPGAHL